MSDTKDLDALLARAVGRGPTFPLAGVEWTLRPDLPTKVNLAWIKAEAEAEIHAIEGISEDEAARWTLEMAMVRQDGINAMYREEGQTQTPMERLIEAGGSAVQEMVLYRFGVAYYHGLDPYDAVEQMLHAVGEAQGKARAAQPLTSTSPSTSD